MASSFTDMPKAIAEFLKFLDNTSFEYEDAYKNIRHGQGWGIDHFKDDIFNLMENTYNKLYMELYPNLCEDNLATDKQILPIFKRTLKDLNDEMPLFQKIVDKYADKDIPHVVWIVHGLVEKAILKLEEVIPKAVEEIANSQTSKELTKQQKKGKLKSDNDTHLLMLKDIVESPEKYNYIMNLLVEKGHCHARTHIWKDEGKGNKGLLAAIIKYLHREGYYKDNKGPTNNEIIAIAQNTFGVTIGEDTIKKTKPDSFDLKWIVSPAITNIPE